MDSVMLSSDLEPKSVTKLLGLAQQACQEFCDLGAIVSKPNSMEEFGRQNRQMFLKEIDLLGFVYNFKQFLGLVPGCGELSEGQLSQIAKLEGTLTLIESTLPVHDSCLQKGEKYLKEQGLYDVQSS